MPERSSKRKARRDSPTSSVEQPETASLRTENIPSISDKDFSEISEMVETSVGKRTKETEMGRRETLKMMENMSLKIDSLFGRAPEVTSETSGIGSEKEASSCRTTRINEMTQDEVITHVL